MVTNGHDQTNSAQNIFLYQSIKLHGAHSNNSGKFQGKPLKGITYWSSIEAPQ